MVVRQVWAGADVMGAPSPDGRYLSFVDWDTGDLALHDFKTGKNRRLTNNSSPYEQGFAEWSIFSPDRKQVAYTWFNKMFYELRIMGLDGSRPRVLYRNEDVEFIQPFDWSPDGKHILTVLFRKGRINQIGLISVADGSVRVLKTLDWRSPQKMSFSPDGRYLVYDFPPDEDAHERDVFLLATDGSRETPLVEHPANDMVLDWAPDGKQILFSSDRTGTLSAWVIRVTDGKPKGAPELVKRDIGQGIVPMGFTEDGTFYYGLGNSVQDVYIATLDPATGQVLATPTPVPSHDVGSNSLPSWSLDGKYLAYVAQQGLIGLGPRKIFIRSLESGTERSLSPPMTYFSRHYWAPDGRSILVAGKDKKGRQGVYQIDVQTGAVTPVVIPDDGLIYQAVWSPEGEQIFYVLRGRGSDRILVRHLKTGQESELFRQFPVHNLALSPDGGQLAFSSKDPGTDTVTLNVIPTSGGIPRELVRVKEDIPFRGSIVWTPDGGYVIFAKTKRAPSATVEEVEELWRVPAEGGEPQKLGLAMKRLGYLSVHPDGRRIAFTAGLGIPEVWVMENFLPETEGTR